MKIEIHGDIIFLGFNYWETFLKNEKNKSENKILLREIKKVTQT